MDEAKDFERVVDLHYASLYRFAFSLTRRESDACDLAQETFLLWARKGHQLREENKVKSWLFTTLYREFLQKQRRVTRFPQVEIDSAGAELPDIPPPSIGRLDRQTVLEALGQVEDRFQAVIALFYLEDYTHPEIAEILDIPVGTVKSRISRGIAQLQRILQDVRTEARHA